MHLRPWFNWLVPALRSYEIAALDSVQQSLIPNAQVIFRHRIEGINLAQRFDGGREVNLYQVKAGKPYFDPNSRFDVAHPECRLATVRCEFVPEDVAAGSVDRRITCDVWLVNGYVFSLEFDKSPEPMGEHCKLVANEVEAHLPIFRKPAARFRVE